MKKLITVSMLIASIALASCGPTELVVRERPVAPVYVRPARPYPSYVWVEGNYVRSGNGYVYRQGYWAAPRHRSYKPGYWKQKRGGYIWVQGRYM